MIVRDTCLCATVYRDAPMPRMSTINLLVKEQDIGAAKDVLLELQYRTDLSNDGVLSSKRFGPPPDLLAAFPVVLHSEVELPTQDSAVLQDLWSDASELVVGGCQVYVPTPTGLLIDLCVQASCIHRFRTIAGVSAGLREIYDIAKSVSFYESDMDFENLYSRAMRLRSAKHVYLCLLLANELFHADIPRESLVQLERIGLDQSKLEWAKEELLSDWRVKPEPPYVVDMARDLNADSLARRIVLILLHMVVPVQRANLSSPRSKWLGIVSAPTNCIARFFGFLRFAVGLLCSTRDRSRLRFSTWAART